MLIQSNLLAEVLEIVKQFPIAYSLISDIYWQSSEEVEGYLEAELPQLDRKLEDDREKHNLLKKELSNLSAIKYNFDNYEAAEGAFNIIDTLVSDAISESNSVPSRNRFKSLGSSNDYVRGKD